MNNNKCEIFTDRKLSCISENYVFSNPELKTDPKGDTYPTELCGIKIVPYVKYLGVIIAVDRKCVVGAAKIKSLKYVKRIGHKALSTNDKFNKLVRTMYFESLLQYHFTPLVAAGYVSKEDLR